MIFGVDISHYNDVPIDHDGLLANNFKFAIAKMGQGLKEDPFLFMHESLMRRRGWLFGGYYWLDPLIPAQAQYEHAADLAQKYKIRVIFPDVEQWWASWDKWLLARQGKISMSSVPKLSPAQIYNSAAEFITFLDDGGLKCIPYWRVTFMTDYCRALLGFFHGRDNWIAWYPDSFARKVSWKTWHAMVPTIVKPAMANAAPCTPDDVLIRQYHDRITMPWMIKPIDINAFFGTEEELLWWFEE